MRNFISAFDYRSLPGATAPELVFGKFSESHDFIVNDADFEKKLNRLIKEIFFRRCRLNSATMARSTIF